MMARPPIPALHHDRVVLLAELGEFRRLALLERRGPARTSALISARARLMRARSARFALRGVRILP